MTSPPRRILVTGSAGFIGFHLARFLLAKGFQVLGYDRMTDHYDVALKRRRRAMLLQSPAAPFRVVNIGNSTKVRLADFIEAIEESLGRKAIRKLLPMQTGDVPATWADASLLHRLTGYRPQTELREGVAKFVAWYREYHHV